MSWIFLALVAYLINAISFVVDKYLLELPIPKPFAYAFWVSILSLGAVFLIPFGVYWPGYANFLISLLSGATFFVAVLFFYKSIKGSDVSVGATSVGTFSAIFSYLFSLLILHEGGVSLSYPALGFLIAGLILLNRSGKSVTLFSAVAGAALALSLVLLKKVFYQVDFINGIFWTRMGFVLAACLPLFWQSVRQEVLSSFHQAPVKSRVLLVGNKLLVGLGFIILYYAIRIGNVVIINAMQGLQFVFILILALLITRHLPVLREQTSRRNLIIKIAGVALIVAGFLLAI